MMSKREFVEWMDNEGGFLSLVRHGFDPGEIKSVSLRLKVIAALPAAQVIIDLETELYED